MVEMNKRLPDFREKFKDEMYTFLKTHQPDLFLHAKEDERFFCELDSTNNTTYISLGQMFPLWMKGVHASSIVLEKSVFTPFIALMCFATPRGELFILAQMKESPVRKMYLMETGNETDNPPAASINITAGGVSGSSAPEIVAVTAIYPYHCAACLRVGEKKRYRKCSRCWELLGLSARYCSKACQLAHYPVHRRVCGKRELGEIEHGSGPCWYLFHEL